MPEPNPMTFEVRWTRTPLSTNAETPATQVAGTRNDSPPEWRRDYFVDVKGGPYPPAAFDTVGWKNPADRLGRMLASYATLAPATFDSGTGAAPLMGTEPLVYAVTDYAVRLLRRSDPDVTGKPIVV